MGSFSIAKYNGKTLGGGKPGLLKMKTGHTELTSESTLLQLTKPWEQLTILFGGIFQTGIQNS